MKKYIILILITFTFLGCNKKEIGVLIQRPVDKELDNKDLIIKLNDNEVYKEILKFTDIIPLHTSTEIPIEKLGMNKLLVLVGGEEFEFKFDYPKDKYLLISPSFIKNEIKVNFKKSKEKFKTY